jgi:hypothetical protein
MKDKSSIQSGVAFLLAFGVYCSVGGLVLAQSDTRLGQTAATDSATLGRVNQLNAVDVGEGSGAPQEIALPDVPEVTTCQEAPMWWLPLLVLIAGNGYVGYLVWIQGAEVSFGWVIGLGLVAYFIYSVIGCGCGEIGWCDGTPMYIALLTTIHGGVLWARQASER